MENIFRVTGHLCGNSPAPGEFPAQWPGTRSIDVFFDLRLNKRLSKQSWGWCLKRYCAHYDVTVLMWYHQTPADTKSWLTFADIML